MHNTQNEYTKPKQKPTTILWILDLNSGKCSKQNYIIIVKLTAKWMSKSKPRRGKTNERKEPKKSKNHKAKRSSVNRKQRTESHNISAKTRENGKNDINKG